MKTKIIIGLLSVTTVGATSYAIVENNIHNNEIEQANNTIAQYSEDIKTQDNINEENDYYANIINRLEILEENINTLNNEKNSSEIDEIENNIKKLENSITSIKNNINSKNIIGKWTTSENSELIYEFKNDGTFYINNEYAGIYTDFMMIRDIGLGKTIMFYSRIDNNTIKCYYQTNGTTIYYYESILIKVN